MHNFSLRNILLLCGFHYVSLSILIIVLLVVALLFCCWSSWGCHPKNLTELEMLWLSLRRMPPSFPFLPPPSLLPRTCCIRYYRLPIKHLSSLLPSFIPSFLHPFLPYFLSSCFLPCFLPSLLSGFIFLDAHLFFWCKCIFFSTQSEFFLAPLSLDIGSSKKSICSAMVYLVFCCPSNGSYRDGSLSPICRSRPGIETWSSCFGGSACIMCETISSSFWASVLLATGVFEFGTCLRPMVGSFCSKIYQFVLIALQYDLTISTDLLVSYASNLVLPVNRMTT